MNSTILPVPLDDFKKELSELLVKYNAAIIVKSERANDMNLDIGFQFGIHNKWIGRHHVTGYDLSNQQ